jgi:ribulose kinase
MTTITITFDDDVLTKNNLDMNDVTDMAYLRSLVFNVNTTISNLHEKIMEEMSKPKTLISKACIDAYTKDIQILNNMKPSLAIKVS